MSSENVYVEYLVAHVLTLCHGTVAINGNATVSSLFFNNCKLTLNRDGIIAQDGSFILRVANVSLAKGIYISSAQGNHVPPFLVSRIEDSLARDTTNSIPTSAAIVSYCNFATHPSLDTLGDVYARVINFAQSPSSSIDAPITLGSSTSGSLLMGSDIHPIMSARDVELPLASSSASFAFEILPQPGTEIVIRCDGAVVCATDGHSVLVVSNGVKWFALDHQGMQLAAPLS